MDGRGLLVAEEVPVVVGLCRVSRAGSNKGKGIGEEGTEWKGLMSESQT